MWIYLGTCGYRRKQSQDLDKPKFVFLCHFSSSGHEHEDVELAAEHVRWSCGRACCGGTRSGSSGTSARCETARWNSAPVWIRLNQSAQIRTGPVMELADACLVEIWLVFTALKVLIFPLKISGNYRHGTIKNDLQKCLEFVEFTLHLTRQLALVTHLRLYKVCWRLGQLWLEVICLY